MRKRRPPAILAASFVPPVVVPDGERLGTGAGVTALLLSASLLAIASAALFPFQMRTVVSLSGDRLDATRYGFYSTGVGILIGILAIRSLMSAAHRLNADEIVWSGLVLVGPVAVAWAVPAGQNRRRSEVVGPKSGGIFRARLCRQAT
jgi:hypothetical protein